MTSRILDGAALAKSKIIELKQIVTSLQANGSQPGLATVQVGDDPASRIYIRNKTRACVDAGVYSENHAMEATCNETEVLSLLQKLNADARIHGIILQLPLPRHLNARRLSQAIAMEKDVDGFNWRNLGALVEDAPQICPCTPMAVMTILDHGDIEITGKHAVVVGRSSVVGKPAALLLISRGATVTVCNSRTPDLAAMTRQADILVAAAGKPELITRNMVKPGAAVIDVGINRKPDGKLCGDVAFEEVKEIAGWITPVPGGIGPMTVAMLIANTVKAAQRSVQTGLNSQQ